MSKRTAALLAEALAHQRAGRLDPAAAAFAEAARQSPLEPAGWRGLGIVAQQQGRFADSLEPTLQALALQRRPADLSNLANALNSLGRNEEALAAAEEAAAVEPGFAAAHANAGVALRALGRRPEAVERFRAACRLEPRNAEAQANLGVTLTELGLSQEAEVALEAALRLKPDWADGWYNLGNARLRQLRWAEAEAAYRYTLQLRPGHAEAHANLAASQKALGRSELALAHYAEAARLNPQDWRVLQNHALMLAEGGRHAEAVPIYEAALTLAPEVASLHANLGSALQEWARRRHDAGVIALLDRAILADLAAVALDPALLPARSNLGLAFLARGRFEEAVQAFQEAIFRAPDVASLYSNLGQCLADLARLEEAEAACRRALELDPALPEAWSTLGSVHVGQRRHADAEAAYREALRLRPGMAGAWCNLGVALFRERRVEEAEAAYARAIALEPGLADAQWNQALLRLQRGEYAEGFDQYEWRLKRSGRIRDEAGFSQPLWDGQELGGQPILVHAEQGFGDALQCVRFLPRIAERGGRVLLQAREPLRRLLEHAPGVDGFVPAGEPLPPVACRAPLFSLPRLFARSLDALPGPYPYLSTPEPLKEPWRTRLESAAPEGFRIGIVWSGNVASEVEQGRSIPLAAFAPLAQAGVGLVSLQKGDGLEQVAAAPFPVADLGEAYAAGDFADTAAVLEGVDLLVTCDTAAAHLAGALGRPAWLAISAVPDWRWLEGRSDSPWYPSVRIFRQRERGRWDDVFAAMAERLAARFTSPAPLP